MFRWNCERPGFRPLQDADRDSVMTGCGEERWKMNNEKFWKK